MTRPRPLSLRVYGLITRAAAWAAPALLVARAKLGKEDPTRLGERLGRAGRPRPPGQLAWLHGVSVGESLSLLPLVDRLRGERPGVAVLVTSGTRASGRLLEGRLPEGVIHQYAPVDTPGAVRRFLDHWRPDLGVFVESELWPNLILTAKERGIRLALVSARMSRGSFEGWRRAPGAARAILDAFQLILARDEEAAGRLRALGARVDGVADMKFGADPLPADPAELATLRATLDGRAVILAASTHAGEEALVLERFAAVATARDGRALLIIAPRHIDRAPDIVQLCLSRGFSAARRMVRPSPDGLDVYVADTVGDLGLWYRLAGLAVLGGSLAPGVGGHNPLEPARLGCPFVSGIHVEDWPVYEDLEAAQATRCLQAGDLDESLRAVLDAPASLAAMAGRARRFVLARDREMRAVHARVLGLLNP
ncbi:MAG: glycosyltransferase N-terminal domain-containing protein [Pseudomonadota bacterium]